MFFEFDQNNTGGHFTVDKNLCHRLFIEASDTGTAIDKAVAMGVYFNGCDDGSDCPCCGDRWHEPYDPITFPHKYGSFSDDSEYKFPFQPNRDGWGSKYGADTIDTPNKPGYYDVSFKDIKGYVQYLADAHGWTSPDARIFFANGVTVEIFGTQVEEQLKAAEEKKRLKAEKKQKYLDAHEFDTIPVP